MAMVVLLGPAWLFADSLASYRLVSDDFPYLAASRRLDRALENLFVPHNTHVVPSWRVLTWLVSAYAGTLADLQTTLAMASYGILATLMVLAWRFVALETGRSEIGLGAAIALGTTGLMHSAATWYSASQTLWAGFFILATLWYLQGWRRAGGGWRLVAAALAAVLAGGFWTIGHAAGPVGAVYLWSDGRPRCRRASVVPLLASVLAVGVALGLGRRGMSGPMVSVHGRTVSEAINLVQGLWHTLQAIPENLVIGNLGLATESTPTQGAVLTLLLALVWVGNLWKARRRPNPLECSGATLVLVSYYVEWSFRGYLPFSSLRGPIVPWYDSIPHIGAVLFAAGWWSGRPPDRLLRRLVPITRAGALVLLLFQTVLITLHQPRAEERFELSVPGMNAEEAKEYLIPALQRLRAVAVADLRVHWQRRHLTRLDQAEVVARRLGIDREAIRQAFGRVNVPGLPKIYDAADLLDLPRHGREHDLNRVRQALGPFFAMEPEPSLPLPSEFPPGLNPSDDLGMIR
ncbi:MAG: hypothetical protein ABI353_15555 [Isosphaeraceae bacterium]